VAKGAFLPHFYERDLKSVLADPTPSAVHQIMNSKKTEEQKEQALFDTFEDGWEDWVDPFVSAARPRLKIEAGN
jgi:hypothetical protein